MPDNIQTTETREWQEIAMHEISCSQVDNMQDVGERGKN